MTRMAVTFKCRSVDGGRGLLSVRLIYIICVVLAILHTLPVMAVESGKLIEKDGKYVFVESMDPSLKLLLDRSVKNGLISQEDYDRVIK